MKITDTFMNT